jgi:hypothetical protein
LSRPLLPDPVAARVGAIPGGSIRQAASKCPEPRSQKSDPPGRDPRAIRGMAIAFRLQSVVPGHGVGYFAKAAAIPDS